MKALMRVAILCTVVVIPASFLAQQASSIRIPDHVRSTAAFAEVLLRTTELKAELEAITEDHTEASSRVIDLRSEMDALTKTTIRLATVRPTDSGKLTLALGKLLVRKAALDADLARLLRSYKPDHPDVRRANKKVEIFEAAVREVLP